jgi:polar amino acid transport system permease protein
VCKGEIDLITLEGFQKALLYMDMFLEGMACTVTLSALTVIFGFVLALVLALMRMSKVAPLRWAATVYVEVFRATPMLVQVFIVYYILLADIPLPSFKLFGFIRFERMVPGVIALSMNSAAYLSEIIRSGIQSIDQGQTEAARSLGMSPVQTMRYIVLPQAIKNILPAIANEFVTIIKESSICYTIGVQDIMSAVKSAQMAAFTIAEPLLIAAAIYFCLTFPTSKIIAYFERKMSRGDKR